MTLMTLQNIVQWDSQDEAQDFFQRIIGEARICMEKSETSAETSAKEDLKELETLCCTELLDLLQKIAKRKIRNENLQAVITAKIASLREETGVLRAEIREQFKKSGPNERWKEDHMTSNIVHQFVKAFTRKSWSHISTSIAKGLGSHNRKHSIKGPTASTAASSTPSSASSSRSIRWRGVGRSRTPTPSVNSINRPTSDTPSSQQSLLSLPDPEQATAIGEMMTSRAEEFVAGGSIILGDPTEAPELSSPTEEVVPDLDYRDICSSSAKLSAHISTNLVTPFLQSLRSKMINLADTRTHHMEKVYERTLLGVMAEYEEAIKKEEDLRQRTAEDQRVRSTLAQLQLWANVTAAVSAIEALAKARDDTLQKPADLGSPVLSPISL
jgi:hypothetical protein